jgi:hypothetical protein
MTFTPYFDAVTTLSREGKSIRHRLGRGWVKDSERGPYVSLQLNGIPFTQELVLIAPEGQAVVDLPETLHISVPYDHPSGDGDVKTFWYRAGIAWADAPKPGKRQHIRVRLDSIPLSPRMQLRASANESAKAPDTVSE